ncbi:unnamed protein product [Macrosiphum euphorbiae]|uniref:Uncharacterized protein n=1 Tax=Macrosiphum euphorbiae TaxID=13131 RepID=A0AAV0XRW1_9HEMI|nr:unnamed protein product [Macrosiphum euphorbiae]
MIKLHSLSIPKICPRHSVINFDDFTRRSAMGSGILDDDLQTGTRSTKKNVAKKYPCPRKIPFPSKILCPRVIPCPRQIPCPREHPMST